MSIKSIKDEKGLTGVDIAISLVIVTMFVAIIANLIANINLDTEKMDRKSKALAYAVQEIETRRATGYIEKYNGMGTSKEGETLKEEDIYNNSEFTGYHKVVSIKDDILVENSGTKTADTTKQITVEVFYKLGNKVESIKISTYISKE